MGKINQHIEKLLAYHDYVVVPGLGGFVVQMQSASIFADRIIAPLASVGFNPLMHHADGLLAIEIARSEGITYRKAMEIIESEVESIKDELAASKSYQFGNLGLLSQNENGAIIFVPSSRIGFLPGNIGLIDLYVSERQLNTNSGSRKISFVLPTARTFRYAAAAALLFGMLMISPQVNDVRRTDSADLVSLSAFKPMNVNPSSEIISSCPQLVRTELANGMIQNNDSDLYHVVVASLPTRQSAENYCQTLKSENFECAHVLSPIKSYRVSIQSFVDRDEAIRYMENLRKSDSRFETAWVLCK
ncbi:MAG: SPOR domain-containing protein [Paludibacter sp.]